MTCYLCRQPHHVSINAGLTPGVIGLCKTCFSHYEDCNGRTVGRNGKLKSIDVLILRRDVALAPRRMETYGVWAKLTGLSMVAIRRAAYGDTYAWLPFDGTRWYDDID